MYRRIALFLACLHRTAHHQDAVDLVWLWDIHLLASRLTDDERTFLVDLAIARAMRGVCARGLAAAAARFDSFADAIRKVGPEFCILSSDLGQKNNPLPADGFAAFIVALKSRGFSDQELDRMAKQNPAALLGLH